MSDLYPRFKVVCECGNEIFLEDALNITYPGITLECNGCGRLDVLEATKGVLGVAHQSPEPETPPEGPAYRVAAFYRGQ
jgi:hypothetical protein